MKDAWIIEKNIVYINLNKLNILVQLLKKEIEK